MMASTGIFKSFGAFDWTLVCGVLVCSVLYSSYTASGIMDYDWLGTIGAVTGIISVLFATHRNIMTYAFGFVSVVIYGFVSYNSNVLGDCLLYFVYYLPMQIVGWKEWSKHTIDTDATIVVPSPMSFRKRCATFLCGLLAVTLLGIFLAWLKSHNTEYPFIGQWNLYSKYPFRDAVTTVFAIIGQYLMVRAYAQQWFYWIVVDVVSISMWFLLAADGTPHAGAMGIMYVFYLANCINGVRLWGKKSDCGN